jgi:UDP-N-acetylglucosamine transferase subunit ALG13
LYHATIPSIIITHQLAIKTGFAKWTEKILQKRNYRFLNKFTLCWVPDFSGNTNLAGELSHPTTLPAVPVHYIGLLTRLAQKEVNEIEKHLLVLISGPEPQRSMLEERVIEQICHYNGTATVLRGLPGSSNLAPSTGMLKFHNHLSAEELSHEMKKAAYVISRSGYSTIMDIATMNKKSILIPTPGQTEQEYLGRYLMGKKMAVTVPQNEFSLSVALQTAYNFDYADFEILANNLLKEAISHFLHQSFSADFG